MAFETGTALGINDLFTKLSTFAVANGWVQDRLDLNAAELSLHKNGVFVQWRWDPTTPSIVAVYQSTGFNAGVRNGLHPGDSDNGFNTSSNTADGNLGLERAINPMGDGPFPSYHFFEQDAGPAYLHVVVQVNTDVYRHFGFGELNKFGDWTGGDYVYGQTQLNSILASTANCKMLDGFFPDSSPTTKKRAPTMRISSFPGQLAGSVYAQVWGSRTLTTPNDSAGNPKMRVQGGFQGGPVARHFGWYRATSSAGLVPMYPITLFSHDDSLNEVRYLGAMADVRGVNIGAFAGGDEVTIGTDVWVFFPTSQKTLSAVSNRTYNQGIAYKKVTA